MLQFFLNKQAFLDSVVLVYSLNSFIHYNIHFNYLYMKLYFRVTKFHVMSPLTFTMSAISQITSDQFEVTISLDSVANNAIGSHVVCLSSEISTRQVGDFCSRTDSVIYYFLLAFNHLYQPLSLYILTCTLTRRDFSFHIRYLLPPVFKRFSAVFSPQ